MQLSRWRAWWILSAPTRFQVSIVSTRLLLPCFRIMRRKNYSSPLVTRFRVSVLCSVLWWQRRGLVPAVQPSRWRNHTLLRSHL